MVTSIPDLTDGHNRSTPMVAFIKAAEECRQETQSPYVSQYERRFAEFAHTLAVGAQAALFKLANALAVEEAEAELALEDAADAAAARMQALIDAAEPDPALTNIIRPDWSVMAKVRRNFARSAADTNPDPRPAA